jgi:hypothetical protein
LKRFTTKQVLKAIGEPHLQLIDDGGCWCFIYDDKTTGVFDTYRIYTMRLTDFPLCDWVGEGRGFVANVKKRSMPRARSEPPEDNYHRGNVARGDSSE